MKAGIRGWTLNCGRYQSHTVVRLLVQKIRKYRWEIYLMAALNILFLPAYFAMVVKQVPVLFSTILVNALFMVFPFLLLSLVSLLRSRILFGAVLSILWVLVSLPILVFSTVLLVFGSEPSTAIIFILKNANFSEAMEFSRFYLNPSLAVFLALSLVIPIIIISRLAWVTPVGRTIKSRFLVALLLLGLLPSIGKAIVIRRNLAFTWGQSFREVVHSPFPNRYPLLNLYATLGKFLVEQRSLREMSKSQPIYEFTGVWFPNASF